jgi:hypothetical protein
MRSPEFREFVPATADVVILDMEYFIYWSKFEKLTELLTTQGK